jgi:hypothetical protein
MAVHQKHPTNPLLYRRVARVTEPDLRLPVKYPAVNLTGIGFYNSAFTTWGAMSYFIAYGTSFYQNAGDRQ